MMSCHLISFVKMNKYHHGLVCLCCLMNNMLVIWNLSTGKSFGIADPNHSNARNNIYGFGVCPDTSDPTVLKIIQTHNKPWHVEAFTLSASVWNVIRSSNLLRQSIKLASSPHVVINMFIYWVACVYVAHGKFPELECLIVDVACQSWMSFKIEKTAVFCITDLAS
nr:hypothetical protein [Tanacetum cinerariifolium]